VSRIMFAFAMAIGFVAHSSSAQAQASAQESLNQATQLLGAIAASSESDAGRRIATLEKDFADFVSTYAGSAAPSAASGTAGAVGTTGVAADTDWRARYRRVEDDLAALIGSTTSSSSPTPSSLSLDADTRSQLEMVRSHLQTFYAATMSAPDGNPVARTGAPQTGATAAPSSAAPPVAPTAEAPQTPSAQPAPAPTSPTATAPPPPSAPAATPRVPQVDTDLGGALALLDRVQRILDDAVKEPGKAPAIDRAAIDEMRAEITQVRTMLKPRQP
jgi:hypothetical protein